MKNIANQDLFRKTIHWLLVVLVVLYLVTGFGITEFKTVETLTFGLLTKNWAFKIHNNLWIPFIILLGLHICLSLIKRRKKER
jgi:cytochrome b561